MEGYVLVEPNSDIFNRLNDVYTYQENWTAHREEIESFLGFPMEEGLLLITETLAIKESALLKYRPEWQEFFKKDGTSRVYSDLHKQWQEIVKTCNLRVYDFASHVTFAIDSPWGSVKKAYQLENAFYMEIDIDRFNFKKNPWAKPVKKSHFLRLYANYLDTEDKRG